MTDTHLYDGKIKNEIDLQEYENLDIEEKKKFCFPLTEKIKNSEAKIYLEKIYQDIGNHQNFDPTNKINADNLLCACSKLSNNEDFVDELEIQLADMKTGHCPQGRTHRLYQILLAFQ